MNRTAIQAATLALLVLASSGPAGADDPSQPASEQAAEKVTAEQLAKWVEQLQSDQDKIRLEAGLALQKAGPQAAAAVPGLIKILTDKDPDDFRPVFFIIESIGPAAKDAVPVLIKSLDHTSFHVRYLSCRALGGVGAASKAAVPKILELLTGDSASVRKHAARALGLIGAKTAPEIVQPLIRAMRDPLHPVKEQAVIALGNQKELGKPAIPLLKQAVASSQYSARCLAARSLWQLTGKVEPSLAALREELVGTATPWDAARFIGEMGPAAKAAVPDLSDAALSPDTSIRVYAVEALGRLGREAKPALQTLKNIASDDPELEIRDVAAAAVKQIEKALGM